MDKQSSTYNNIINEKFIESVTTHLVENKQVRRTLPNLGRLHIDRQLPFLCVYRYPSKKDAGTERFVMGQPSYLIASGNKRDHESVSQLIYHITKTLSQVFGAFLIIEIWSINENNNDINVNDLIREPEFHIVTHIANRDMKTVETLSNALNNVRLRKRSTTVLNRYMNKIAAPRLSQLLPTPYLQEQNCTVIGIAVKSIYRDLETDELFPDIRRSISYQLTHALQKTVFEFSRNQTTHRPAHFHVLGRRAVVKAVWEVDKKLAEICGEFDFLLQVTPINTETAYHSFKRSHFEKTPIFYYRPLSSDLSLLKRKLWEIRLERIEDPTLAFLFRDKRNELDTQLSMLGRIDTKDFLYGSMQLFGVVDNTLFNTANELINVLASRSQEHKKSVTLNAKAFAELVNEELVYYREQYPGISAKIEIRDDIYAGLMVSKGNILIGKKTNIPSSRAEALIQHEVGTHILTYYNGQAQPFRMLYTGLAGYEEMQEGIAVLSEYLVDGLSHPRLRLLAGRVIAARCLTDGATFIDTYRELNKIYKFTQRTAFTITARIFRSGGLTKDAVYLRGLVQLLNYLRNRGSIEPLFVGKIAAEHIPIIQELQLRKVLKSPPLTPRYMDYPNIKQKIETIRQGITVLDLI